MCRVPVARYVLSALRDLEAQARTDKGAIAALLAESSSPIALPTPAEVAERALGLDRLFEKHPLEVREALRRYFVDGRVTLTVGQEGHYVAEGLPLVALIDPVLSPDQGPQKTAWYRSSCAGAILHVDNGDFPRSSGSGGLKSEPERVRDGAASSRKSGARAASAACEASRSTRLLCGGSGSTWRRARRSGPGGPDSPIKMMTTPVR